MDFDEYYGEELESSRAAPGHSVYKIPLHIVDTARVSTHEEAADVCLAVMFNLALSYHLHALSSNLNKTTYERAGLLHQAISLYEVAYAFLLQEDTTELTMFAIINNLGQIHNIIGNAEKADMCFRHLLSAMLFIQCNDYNDSSNGETNEQNDVFIHNVSNLILQKNVASAA